MVIGGVILLIIAAICYGVSRSSRGRLDAMNAADTYSASLLSELHGKITSTLGSDVPIAEQCEVEGAIECETPLQAPLSSTPCVAYVRTLVREYEEQVTTRDSQGKSTTSMQRRSETIETEDRKVNFWVRDDTGRVLICPEGAELDLVETASRFEEGERGGKSSGMLSGAKTRTLGYRHTEQALPLGVKVYILGCAVDHQGQPMVGCRPGKDKGTFMVSRKSERELAGSAAASAKNFFYGAIGAGALGVILLIAGLITG